MVSVGLNSEQPEFNTLRVMICEYIKAYSSKYQKVYRKKKKNLLKKLIIRFFGGQTTKLFAHSPMNNQHKILRDIPSTYQKNGTPRSIFLLAVIFQSPKSSASNGTRAAYVELQLYVYFTMLQQIHWAYSERPESSLHQIPIVNCFQTTR